MKFYPQFTGEWYGVMCAKGQIVDLDGNLARKAENQPLMFKKPGRKKNDQDKS